MNGQITLEFSRALRLDLTSLDLIKENKYCLIYQAGTLEGPRIIKKYKGDDPSLVKLEAEALRFYHSTAKDDPRLMDSGEPILREDMNLLCVGFVEGEPFSEALYRARTDKSFRRVCVRLMKILGTVIGKIYETTQRPCEETSPFIFEYFDYSSTRLEQMPVLGSILFKGLKAEASELAETFRSSGVTPSFVHGDFVFKNMHVKDERIGLIDFANSNTHSHPLNDIYNLRFALANMILPRVFKEELLSAFYDGLGSLTFPEIADRFYYEYHRRRWLMLKLRSRSPGDIAQGFRGLMTFARPFNTGDTAV